MIRVVQPSVGPNNHVNPVTNLAPAMGTQITFGGMCFFGLYIHSLNVICAAIFLWGLVYSNAVDLHTVCGYCHRGFE